MGICPGRYFQSIVFGAIAYQLISMSNRIHILVQVAEAQRVYVAVILAQSHTLSLRRILLLRPDQPGTLVTVSCHFCPLAMEGGPWLRT
jgi:hypothetical protein